MQKRSTAAPLLADECERLRAENERLARRRESAADAAKRLGFTVTDEQKAANLRRNLGDAAPVYLAAELKRTELIEAECSRLQERVRVLEAALRPFAKARSDGIAHGVMLKTTEPGGLYVFVEWCDAARAALEGIEVE